MKELDELTRIDTELEAIRKEFEPLKRDYDAYMQKINKLVDRREYLRNNFIFKARTA